MKIETVSPRSDKINWRVPAIDGVRALAMLLVYAFHVWEFSGSKDAFVQVMGVPINMLGVFHHGYAGVDLFMVLSGFCLFLPLCKSESVLEKWDARKYFARRIRRIVPPYYAAIAYVVLLPQVLVLLLHLLHQPASWQPWPDLWQFVTHLLFIHTLPFEPFVRTWGGIGGPFWSLGLEAQFYVVFPLVVWGFWKYRFRFIGAMIAISILYCILISRFVVSPHNPVPELNYHTFFLGRWMQFALGMTAAWTVAHHWKNNLWRSAWGGTAVLLGALALYVFALSGTVVAMPPFPMQSLLLAVAFSSAITALCITRTPLRWLFENRAAKSLGFISYSIFLIHQPTAWFFSELLKKKFHLDGLPLLFVLCTVGFAIVLGASALFFRIFEKPFLNPPSRPEPEANPRIAQRLRAIAALHEQPAP